MLPVLTDRQSLTAFLHLELPRFSRAQRQLALYMLQHPERVPFMTTTELARAAGTSQSSVTRFALRLGFESYSAFISVMGDLLLSELRHRAPLERFEQMAGAARVSDLLEQEVTHLRNLAAVTESASFKRSVQRLTQARHVIVAGFGAASALAEHVSLYLTRLRPGTFCVTALDAPLMTQMTHWSNVDCALMFSAPRPTGNSAALIRLFHSRGIQVILIADPLSLSLLGQADETLIVPVTMGATTVLPGAMLALGSIIVDALALEQPERTVCNLQAFEDLCAAAELFISATAREESSWEEKIRSYAPQVEVASDSRT